MKVPAFLYKYNTVGLLNNNKHVAAPKNVWWWWMEKMEPHRLNPQVVAPCELMRKVQLLKKRGFLLLVFHFSILVKYTAREAKEEEGGKGVGLVYFVKKQISAEISCGDKSVEMK